VEGTDGLSHRVWNSALQVSRKFPVSELFEPFPLDNVMIQWAYRQAGLIQPPKVRVFHDLNNWNKADMLKPDCIWPVSPTVAQQALTTAALAWAESPLDSSHLFLVPHVLQCDFGCINCHIQYLGQFDPKELPLHSHPCCVPLLLFYLPPHRRSICPQASCRMDLPSFPRMPAWVAQQVTYMRGLL
jgi:hypothetical protein